MLAVLAAALALLPAPGTRVLTIHYHAHDGLVRPAYVVLPSWYGPRDDPPIPLVISPHGRGVDARANVRLWGDLPARGPFAVVNPEGQGRRLELYSWGDPGQIRDLADMPRLVKHALPWLRIAPHRIYAFGGSMGGQEVLLLVAHHPHLLAGAASFDAPVDLAARYVDFRSLRFGSMLQLLARVEIGGTPRADPRAYAIRSPLDVAGRIAFSGVPLQIWWSTSDRVVVDQRDQSGALYREILDRNPEAPIDEVVGEWRHCAEYHWDRRLPAALERFGLLPTSSS